MFQRLTTATTTLQNPNHNDSNPRLTTSHSSGELFAAGISVEFSISGEDQKNHTFKVSLVDDHYTQRAVKIEQKVDDGGWKQIATLSRHGQHDENNLIFKRFYPTLKQAADRSPEIKSVLLGTTLGSACGIS